MHILRTLIVAAFGALLLAGSATVSLAQELPRPKVIAVQVFASWCEPCLDMEAAVGHLADRFDGEPILGIVLDVTDLSTRYHAQLLAGALELDELYHEKKGTLGEIYLVDGKSKALIETITGADDFETMSVKVRNALASR
jgi:thiol-disulfide isomerase/thioredoxin